MNENLFYGGDIPSNGKIPESDKNKAFYWVTTRLIRESGPWCSEYLRTPEAVRDMMCDHLDLENCDRENFVTIYLDRKGKVNAAYIVSIGGIHSSIVHPREVFKPALMTSSFSVILVHNHPSGDPNPSPEDIEITRRLMEAGKILGIEVMDHVIVGCNSYLSMKARGLI